MAPSDLSSFLSGSQSGAADAPPKPAGPDLRAPEQGGVPQQQQKKAKAAPEPVPPLDLDAPLAGGDEEGEEPSGDGSGEPALVVNRFEVSPGFALPALDRPGSSAFGAEDKRKVRNDVYALVVQTDLPMRTEIFNAVSTLDMPALQRLVAFGIAYWGPDQQERPILVLEQPRGTKLVPSLEQKRPPMGEDQVVRALIQPMIPVLRELKGRRIFHGAVNPTNIYGREGSDNFQLGEFVSTPAGYTQPAIFETVERAMAMPSGRGPGNTADDLYALGATALYLLLGRSPLAGMSPDAIAAAKIERGSFAALGGDARAHINLVEMLRGLLMDDARQRWTVDDLEQWAAGRRMTSKQSPPPKRAARPITLDGRDYGNPRLLATAMTNSVSSADLLVENGELETWVRRSLSDEPAANRVGEAIRAAASARGPTEERRIARVALALDPPAPMRYRGRSVHPNGFGPALAEAMVTGDGIQEFAEMVAGQLPAFWVGVQDVAPAENAPIIRSFDLARGKLDRTEPGFGIERCLYELNPSMPCISPMLNGRYVMDPDTLLYALEEVAADPERPPEPLDRHVAAFIAARHPGLGDDKWQMLGPQNDPKRRTLAMLYILVELQRGAKMPPLPNLAGWIATLLQPAIDAFNSRKVREHMAKELEREAASGVLSKLAALVQNEQLIERDSRAFMMARQQYAVAGFTIDEKERALEALKGGAGGLLGRQLAAVVSALISSVLLVGIVLTQTM